MIIQLKRGTRVKISDWLVVGYEIENSDGVRRKGYWLYVDTGIKDKKGDTIKGWVMDVYLEEEY
ncbi:hypothetical protein [Thermospira aquatica]|uniref:Uncharacterized protein n=1 Tax=Thermospira aquatica TaxID=2828656 RepID=A0AAX3BDD1_9SPIR|nr:hypothetical protein [Thermospira aquatica]URA10264.1 hypothetical protein KDW03_00210 [Thermospira aquatica]